MFMSKILITGASGNIGKSVIKQLFSHLKTSVSVYPGVRNPGKSSALKLERLYQGLNFKILDFENPSTFPEALEDIDLVFLLRPSHISEVKKYFQPFINALIDKKIRGVVFISVQGVEKSSVIPHNKIEKLISQSGIPYVFLRPSYFMQNLTTTLYDELKRNQRIIVPSGEALFNWVDVESIGEVAAVVLGHFETYTGQAFDITGYENLNFLELVRQINESTSQNLEYNSFNPISFYFYQKRTGKASGFIMVMIMLHFLPRFQPPPVISNAYEKLTGNKPNSLRKFIERERSSFSF
jgi:uncharacterized protein YbjT (DUF2867 family)